jgi:hypothetical protein
MAPPKYVALVRHQGLFDDVRPVDRQGDADISTRPNAIHPFALE